MATVRGAAGDLILALYGRIPLDRLTVDGDGTVIDQLRTWADTQ